MDRSFIDQLENIVQNLPKEKEYIPLYLNLLKITDDVKYWGNGWTWWKTCMTVCRKREGFCLSAKPNQI
jgi:hypothetical protein